jgi:hypothetical protein
VTSTAQRALVDEAEAVGLAAEVDVLGDVAVRQQVELLVDDADAGALGIERVRERDAASEQRDLALVGVVRAAEDLHQRRLAGAVLADQRVHLADAAVEVDAVDRGDGAEALHDAAHLERVRRSVRSAGGVGRGDSPAVTDSVLVQFSGVGDAGRWRAPRGRQHHVILS